MITFQQLNLQLAHKQVLQNINFEIQPGAITSIVGPSGAGKTVLLKCLLGLQLGYTGKIWIDKNLQAEFLKSNRIACVFQNYSNFPWLTAAQNISIAAPGAEPRQIQEIIHKVGLQGFESWFVGKLSGGMAQRVAIARSIMQNTGIIAMDEPFAALDFRTRERLQILLKELNRENGKTIVFVTHDIEEAIFISDHIVALGGNPCTVMKKYGPMDGLGQFALPRDKYSGNFTMLRKRIEEEVFNEQTEGGLPV